MKLLKQLYQIASPSRGEQKMIEFITNYITNLGCVCWTDRYGNVYAVKGESDTYPCVVSHTDEVHQRSRGFQVKESEGIIFGYNKRKKTFHGIGADDKNGIWVCLNALAEFPVMKCAFFVSEEVGCVGSSSADMSFFDDCRFVIQCDRRGKNDFINYAGMTELCSTQFMDAIPMAQYGYVPTRGLMTDVMELKERGLAVSACNLSCGYYNPHSNSELTVIKDLLNCYGLVRYIVLNCTDVYPHENAKNSLYSDWDFGEKSSFSYLNDDVMWEQYAKQYDEFMAIASMCDASQYEECIKAYSGEFPLLNEYDYEFIYDEIFPTK